MLGDLYYRRDDLDAAISEFKEAIRIDPDNAGFHFNLGLIYQAQGNPDPAIAEFKEAGRLDPDFKVT
jgi:tetratricopeptide (TPR) repeat protein